MIIAIDPGTYNSGIAIIEGNTIRLSNLPAHNTDTYIDKLINDIDNIEKIIIGNTKSKDKFSKLLSVKPEIIRLVDEKNSTMDARQLCMQYYLKKLNLFKAVSVFFNGSHCDDWAALVLYSRESNIDMGLVIQQYKILETTKLF